MVDAGIIISEETLAAFNNVKMSKKAKWIIFKIQDQKEVITYKLFPKIISTLKIENYK